MDYENPVGPALLEPWARARLAHNFFLFFLGGGEGEGEGVEEARVIGARKGLVVVGWTQRSKIRDHRGDTRSWRRYDIGCSCREGRRSSSASSPGTPAPPDLISIEKK